MSFTFLSFFFYQVHVKICNENLAKNHMLSPFRAFREAFHFRPCCDWHITFSGHGKLRLLRRAMWLNCAKFFSPFDDVNIALENFGFFFYFKPPSSFLFFYSIMLHVEGSSVAPQIQKWGRGTWVVEKNLVQLFVLFIWAVLFPPRDIGGYSPKITQFTRYINWSGSVSFALVGWGSFRTVDALRVFCFIFLF